MLGSLDFVYLPSRDVAADLAHWTRVGGEVVFAVERFETRVAMVDLGDGPGFLLAEHLHGDAPVLVYRVDDLEAEVARLAEDGVQVTEPFEFPYGDAVEVLSPGPQRVALYARTRPERGESLRGRRDF
jgi:predicted enzyme related to lactoylglutathione lyase